MSSVFVSEILMLDFTNFIQNVSKRLRISDFTKNESQFILTWSNFLSLCRKDFEVIHVFHIFQEETTWNQSKAWDISTSHKSCPGNLSVTNLFCPWHHNYFVWCGTYTIMYVRMHAYEQYYIGMRMRALKGYDNSSSLNITLVLVFALGGILPRGTCFDSSNPIFNRRKGLILFSLLFSCQLACRIVSIATHYFLSASFCWMLAEGIHIYNKIVRVFSNKKYNKVFYVLGWGKLF